MSFVFSPRISLVIITRGVILSLWVNLEVILLIDFLLRLRHDLCFVCLAESLADKTRVYWPYMALMVAGACLVSLLIICCCCHQIRRSMYNKRKGKGNFDSKTDAVLYFINERFHRGLTYQNHNSHSQPNSHGKQSLGMRHLLVLDDRHPLFLRLLLSANEKNINED